MLMINQMQDVSCSRNLHRCIINATMSLYSIIKYSTSSSSDRYMYMYVCLTATPYSMLRYILCAYLLRAKFNGSALVCHKLHAFDVFTGRVPLTPVDPAGNDGRGRRETRWTLHEQPPHEVVGEGGIRFLYSRDNLLTHFTLEVSLHFKLK